MYGFLYCRTMLIVSSWHWFALTDLHHRFILLRHMIGLWCCQLYQYDSVSQRTYVTYSKNDFTALPEILLLLSRLFAIWFCTSWQQICVILDNLKKRMNKNELRSPLGRLDWQINTAILNDKKTWFSVHVSCWHFFLKEKFWISFEAPNDNMLVLVQIMAWCRTIGRTLLELVMPYFTDA